jgi:hypothetical protein
LARLAAVLLERIRKSFDYRVQARKSTRSEARKYREYESREFTTGADLLAYHFSTWSSTDHVNVAGFEAAMSLMAGRPQNILETGTSAWGTDSTRLWDAYVRNFGGEFWSVDLSPAPRKRLHQQVSSQTHLMVDDSVHFLTAFAQEHAGLKIDVCYLDSWDLDWANPDPAAIHGLAEWHAVSPLIGPGSALIIDDSPGSLEWVPTQHQEAAETYFASHGYLPGKGALAHQELIADPRVSAIWHGYNSVYVFSDPTPS